VAVVGEIFGVPRIFSKTFAAGFLLAVVWTGSYRRVERVAIALGLFEFAFFWVAYAAHPQGAEVASGLTHVPLHNKDYLYLVAANIGAVLMPWMIFYQQSAIADKKLRPEHYKDARWDTALGAVMTQLVMAAVLVATAATIGKSNSAASLNTVGDISNALTPFMGPTVGRLVFSLGILGAGMVAAIVVSLASAWGFGEVAGYKRSAWRCTRASPAQGCGARADERPAKNLHGEAGLAAPVPPRAGRSRDHGAGRWLGCHRRASYSRTGRLQYGCDGPPL